MKGSEGDGQEKGFPNFTNTPEKPLGVGKPKGLWKVPGKLSPSDEIPSEDEAKNG